MLRLFNLYFLFVVCMSSSFAQDTLHVFFEVNEYKLDQEDIQRLEAFTEHIAQREGMVLIEGYSDPTGAADYNLRLSEDRALMVEAYLNRHGVADQDIRVVFYGESNSLSNDPVFNHEVFRRVDLRFFPLEIESDPTDELPAISSRAFLKMLEPRTQFHRFNNRYKRKVTGKDGVVIRMDRLALRSKYEPSYRGEIILELKEYSTPLHYLAAGMDGRTGGMLLEPHGMMFFRMVTPAGDWLKIKRNKALTVSFPTDSLKDEVQKFFAPLDRQGEVRWSQRRRGKRDYITMADGRLYRESASKRDVYPTMGVKTYNLNDPQAEQLYKSKTKDFGFMTYALPYRSEDQNELVVISKNYTKDMRAVVFLKEQHGLLYGIRDEEQQAFTFKHLPENTTVQVVVYDVSRAETRMDFTEVMISKPKQQIQLTPKPLTGPRLKALEKLLGIEPWKL